MPIADSPLAQKIEAIIAPTLEHMGFRLVRVRLTGNHRLTLQLMAEPLDERETTIEDCAEISRAVSALLDVEDPIQNAYSLEVSSPGIDRPLVRPEDFERYVGFEIKAETVQPLNARKRFRGKLEGLEVDEALIALDTGDVARVPLSLMREAKLVLTDALIQWHQLRVKTTGAGEGETAAHAGVEMDVTPRGKKSTA